MQQIADWLEKLGMSEYAQRFAENRIDFSVLPDLTDQDLEKLGVLLGDRRKILRAIVNLETTAKAAPSAIGAPVAVDGSPRDAAERRQVTVMFSDLVDSTAIRDRDCRGLPLRKDYKLPAHHLRASDDHSLVSFLPRAFGCGFLCGAVIREVHAAGDIWISPGLNAI